MMQGEMTALLTAYFLYYGDASWVFWLVWGLVCFLFILHEIGRVRKQRAKEIEEQRIYWEGK
jgi:hypothetical protein